MVRLVGAVGCALLLAGGCSSGASGPVGGAEFGPDVAAGRANAAPESARGASRERLDQETPYRALLPTRQARDGLIETVVRFDWGLTGWEEYDEINYMAFYSPSGTWSPFAGDLCEILEGGGFSLDVLYMMEPSREEMRSTDSQIHEGETIVRGVEGHRWRVSRSAKTCEHVYISWIEEVDGVSLRVVLVGGVQSFEELEEIAESLQPLDHPGHRGQPGGPDR